MITLEIKLRTFLICWFVSEENTRKQMLIKRLMGFSMYNTLTTVQTWGKNKIKSQVRCFQYIPVNDCTGFWVLFTMN